MSAGSETSPTQTANSTIRASVYLMIGFIETPYGLR
jgi:hypothetical protein